MHRNYPSLNQRVKFMGLPANVSITMLFILFASVIYPFVKRSFLLGLFLIPSVIIVWLYLVLRLYRKWKYPLDALEFIWKLPTRKYFDQTKFLYLPPNDEY